MLQMKSRWCKLSLTSGLVLAVLAGIGHAETPPGVPDVTFPQNELFTFVSQMRAVVDHEVHTVENPEFPLLLNGYIVIPGRQHTSMFDFSDPYNPKLLNRVEMYEEHSGMPEMNAWGITTGYNGVHIAHADTNSLAFWDFTDHMNPQKVSEVALPFPWDARDCGKPLRGKPIAHAWQAPYVYSAMRGIGIDILDVHDIENPTVVKRFETCDHPDHGWLSVGVVHVVGNLLIHSVHVYGDRYIMTMDISDPENPVELDFVKEDFLKNLYCGYVNGNRYFASGPAIHEYDISDPTNMQFVRTYNRTGECNHECSTGGTDVQDNYIHWGGSRSGYEKFDLTTGQSVGVTGPLTNPEDPEQYADLDLVTVFGNMAVVCSEDQYQVIGLVPHQSEPDRNPPVVNMVNPVDDAQGMAVTSRVGLTFTDNIDHRTVNMQTVIVRPEGGEALVGKYSTYKGIVNFSPDACLQANTCYEVVVPAGGVKDYAGNATTEEFTSTFCTGQSGNESVCAKRQGAEGTGIAPALLENGSAGKAASSGRPAAVVNLGRMRQSSSVRIYDIRGRAVDGHFISAGHSFSRVRGVFITTSSDNNAHPKTQAR